MDYFQKSLELHRETQGKLAIASKVPLATRQDLSLAYTPGVARVCEAVEKDVGEAYALTMKGNSVAIVSDGSAVLGLGNIGPQAALPVMEGKAILFKHFADIDGFPLVVDAHSVEDIVTTVRTIAPTFGGINLEDIAAPKCFEIEDALQDIGIPVFHDDQHGTAIVLLAAMLNACKVTGKKMEDLTVAINGAGAAGTAIAKLLLSLDYETENSVSAKEIFLCDSKGIIHKDRKDLNDFKKKTLTFTNSSNRSGSIHDALKGTDVFIGVSAANLLTADDIRTMAPDPFILAMANPTPEIMPEEAKKGGAAIVGTGRSDFPNQVNNVLAFPGIFRGALDARATRITPRMKFEAAYALAAAVESPNAEQILPDPLDKTVAQKVAQAVADAARKDGVVRSGGT